MLILAVGVIAAVMFLIKKISLKRLETKSTVNLNIISKITLQPKNHLFVVKAANKTLVLGVTDSSINILTEINANNDDTDNDSTFTEDLLNTALKNSSTINSEKDLSFVSFLKDSLKLE